VTNGNGRAWQVLYDLPSWQVTQIPRPALDWWLCDQQEPEWLARAGDPGWEQCLAGALTAFQDCSWPLDLLRPVGRDDEH
jgi:hypothetical protein